MKHKHTINQIDAYSVSKNGVEVVYCALCDKKIGEYL
jgi:hypothetical protein